MRPQLTKPICEFKLDQMKFQINFTRKRMTKEKRRRVGISN